MQCPSCGRSSDGKFCPECGTALRDAVCRSCGAPLTPGARFCTQCGAATGAPDHATANTGSNRPWYIAAGVLLLLIAALLVPMLVDTPDADAAAASGEAPFASDGSGTPPPLSDDMRANADRLFNRIMQERESGDPARAEQFYPMAIQAYEASEPLDADGLYHLSLIQAASGDHAAARATAERILTMQPNHLLGLGAAGEAAREQGDMAAARAYYQRFLENYETERTNQYPEYLDHGRIFPRYEQQARSVVSQP